MRIAIVTTDVERLQCFEVLHQLRPTLDRDTFLSTLERLGLEGFTLAALWEGDDVRAVAGFRFLELLATGPQLYVDDLVTSAAHRSRGYGAALLHFLVQHAREHGCRYLELDSGLERHAAHRFYRAQGLEQVAGHFSLPLGDAPKWSEGSV